MNKKYNITCVDGSSISNYYMHNKMQSTAATASTPWRVRELYWQTSYVDCTTINEDMLSANL
jgi:hypothetical protein